jgi:hypothetical protein
VERAGGVADGAGALVERAGGVADSADALVKRAGGVADGASALVERAGGVADGADALVERAGGVAGRADALVGRASGLAESAGGLLDTYEPIAAQAAPLARRFVQEFSEEELVAAIRLVDQLPRLTEHMESDIMPLLATLDRVGPDVHELLNQLREVRQAIQGIPGFRFFSRRGEEIDEEER